MIDHHCISKAIGLKPWVVAWCCCCCYRRRRISHRILEEERDGEKSIINAVDTHVDQRGVQHTKTTLRRYVAKSNNAAFDDAKTRAAPWNGMHPGALGKLLRVAGTCDRDGREVVKEVFADAERFSRSPPMPRVDLAALRSRRIERG